MLYTRTQGCFNKRSLEWGMPTLAERIQEAITESGTKVPDIAARCGISVQAVYGWMRGDTKSIEGANLVELADITGYEARWIAKELGPKKRLYPRTVGQEHVLRAMQQLPRGYESMVIKIVDTVSESDPGKGNGGSEAAA